MHEALGRVAEASTCKDSLEETVGMDEQSVRDKDFDPDLQAEVAPEQNAEADKQMKSWVEDDDKRDELPNVL